MPTPCLLLGISGTLESHCPGWGKSRGLHPVVFAPSFTSSLFRSLPILQRTQLATEVRGRKLEGGPDRTHPEVRVTLTYGLAPMPTTPRQADTNPQRFQGILLAARQGSSLRVRATDWAAPARAPLNCAPPEETKKKKKFTKQKPSLSEGGFKRLRKPPTVKTPGLSQTVSKLAPAHPCCDPARPRCGPNTPSCPPTAAAQPRTPPSQELRGTDSGPFLRNDPKGNPDLGRLVCHCGEAADRTPAKRGYSILKRPRSVTSPRLPLIVHPPTPLPRQATLQASSVFPPKTGAPLSAEYGISEPHS